MGSIAELLKNHRFAPGKGVTAPLPERGVKLFGFLLWNHFWDLVKLNLLFLAFSIPVVTIPAAACGMNRALMVLVREKNCFLWDEFWKEYKANILRSLPLGAVFLCLLYESCAALNVGAAGKNPLMSGIGSTLMVFTTLLFSYAFVLLPVLDLKPRHILKNAFILMISEWKTNLAILSTAVVSVLLFSSFFPYTIFAAPLGFFAIAQLAVCTAVNEPLQRRIIGPYEQS